jgi:glucose-1-phosphate cytidylyltransferase
MFTVATVQPSGPFGVLQINNESLVESFHEKRSEDIGWINAGFFVYHPVFFDYINEGDKTIWERDPLETLAKENNLYPLNTLAFGDPWIH